MVLIRSQPIAGQAANLVLARAERARLVAAEAAERLRQAGRAEAEAEAAQRIAAAEARAAQAEAEARRRCDEHQKSCEERLGRAAGALERALANLAVLESQVVEAAEGEIAHLALAIAAKVLAREVQTDPAWMRGILAEALRELPDRRRVTLRCSPTDAEAIRQRLTAAAAAAPGTEQLQVEADPALAPGSLILSAGGTRLDAGIHGSWERIAAAVIAAAPRPDGTMRDDGTLPEVPP